MHSLNKVKDTPAPLLLAHKNPPICRSLPETDTSEAVIIAERLREKIKNESSATTVGPLTITVSFGVASFNHTLHDFDALLYQADMAMYAAKQAGRDQVCTSF